MTLQVDKVDPVVECGFHDADGINVVEEQTLYAYAGSKLFAHTGQKDIGDLQDAKLYYNITVSSMRHYSTYLWYGGHLSHL